VRKRTLAILLLSASSLFLLLAMVNPGTGKVQEPDDLDIYRQVSEFVDDNEACFKCHGESKFQLEDELTGRVLTRKVYGDYRIIREEYYASNHKSFPCFDCHSKDFTLFPHPLEARLEEPWACLDCHGYDEDYAQYQFEKIEEEYLASTHHLATEEFSCWKCHDNHSYHISIRNTENLRKTIAYDNAICLSCHADFDQFQLLTDRDGINIIQTHDWLPNQALHFQSVRCIECHTQVNDSILVAHLILPKEEAVQSCDECHSSDTRLMHTLYKHQSLEAREKYGFLNAVVMNEAYVIGANRNYILGHISLFVFGLVVLGLTTHLAFRIIKKV